MSKSKKQCSKCKWWSSHPRITNKPWFGSCRLTGCVVYAGTHCFKFEKQDYGKQEP